MIAATRKTVTTAKIPPFPPPNIVKPRKPKARWLPVIAIDSNGWSFTESDQQLHHPDKLFTVLRHHEPAIVVCQDFGKHFKQICTTFDWDDTFTYRVSPVDIKAYRDGKRVVAYKDAICHYFGWRRPNGITKNKFHFPLDPIWYCSAHIDDIDTDPHKSHIKKLYDWGIQFRDWTVEQELRFTASNGGIAAQLLKDPRFYPAPRRKCPKVINRITRDQLPGNYYELRTTPGIPKNAILLDMENAHHALARRVNFPDVQTLHLYGSVPSPDSRYWKADKIGHLLDRHGIFCIEAMVPYIPRNHFPPAELQPFGNKTLYVYSNELSFLRGLGIEILGIWWAAISDTPEPRGTGLGKYAEFAIEQIRRHREYRNWLKPTLHSVYGMLAAQPQSFETGFRGEGWEYPMGSFCVPVRRVRLSRETESGIVNVIHRGMIEAEVRKELLYYARLLEELDHHRVLALYADGIFIEDTGQPLRLLEYPWRVKEAVRHIRFHDSTHFTSPSISRLPGVPRNARERYLRQIQQASGRELR